MKRLVKSTTDVKLNGVCSGIANYFNMDPTIFRVIFIIGSIVTGFIPGLLIYFVLAVIIPKDTDVYTDDFNNNRYN